MRRNNLAWPTTDLPVEGALTAIVEPLAAAGGSVVVTAEPGAGKSSLIPIAVANAMTERSEPSAHPGRVVVLEPRRIAARATAQRLAELVGDEAIGNLIGLTIRGEHKTSKNTHIEVVTEAVLTNRLQADAELPGIDALIFDEFHERNLHSDLALAMALEARATIRPDLAIVVMSATLDATPIAALLGDAPIIEVPGRAFPVTTQHRQRPARNRWAEAVAGATIDALGQVAGDVLVFAPGVGEIDRVTRSLGSVRDTNGKPVDVVGLHGRSSRDIQQSVLRPAKRRRIIVATAVAETSITIPTIEAVVDGGLLRRAVFDPASGLGRLETVHASRFAADQRRGRAGRVGPGICLRLWSEEDHRLLDDAVPPAIVDGDPLPVAVELARWGDPHATDLPLLDHPGAERLTLAHRQLEAMGLSDGLGNLTTEGTVAARLPIDARLGALVTSALEHGGAPQAIRAAAVLNEDIRSVGCDIERAVEESRSHHGVKSTTDRITRSVGKLTSTAAQAQSLDAIMATAWPDRVAMARQGRPGRFLLAVGREVEVDERDPLAGAPFLVVAKADGVARSARVRSAIATDRATVLEFCADHIVWSNEARWDERTNRIVAERTQRLGSIVLHSEGDPKPSRQAVQAALRDGVRSRGLAVFQWSDRASALRQRLAWLHSEAPDVWLDVSDEALAYDVDSWLNLDSITKPSQLRSVDLSKALLDRLDWQQRAALDDLAPTELPLPSGGSARVDYSSGRPVWAVRLQRLFGLDRHPTAGPNKAPITVELLSPANRPAQTTTDLPGFWRGSYQAVRSDLRGRYPKHDWPEDPLA